MCFHSTASTNFLQVLSTMNFSLNILYSPLTLCLKKTSVLNYISYNTPIHPIIFYLSQRILVATLTLCMLFTLFAPAANVNAASKRTKALTAYQKKLKKLDSKIYKFALVYLDKDSIPELVITSKESTHAIYGEIYTYNNGKLKNLKYAVVILVNSFILQKNLQHVILHGLMDMVLFLHFTVLVKLENQQSSNVLMPS